MEQVQDANTPLADLLPPDELGSRGGEGLLRGGDVGANTMERCTAQDRYVVFHTTEALDPVRDTNAKHDVYLRDLQTGGVELVSLTPAGTAAGNNMSVYGVISQDGRYVAFASTATNLVVFTSLAKNLVAGDTNNWQDIFLCDVSGNTTVRIAGGNSTCYQPAISGDGRYVAFTSLASNLVVGDTNGKLDAFLFDRNTTTTERLSVASNGTQGNGPCYMPSVSDDGQRVAFDCAATNLVPGDTNGVRDVFVRDRTQGLTLRVSLSDGGAQADGDSFHASLTRAGDRVAFSSEATNLKAGDTNGVRDIFWREVAAERLGSAWPMTKARPLEGPV